LKKETRRLPIALGALLKRFEQNSSADLSGFTLTFWEEEVYPFATPGKESEHRSA